MFPVFELSLIGVAHPNVANQESIILRPAQEVDLTDFGLLVGQRQPNGVVVPLRDHFFWFGNLVVRPPSWLIVHTGFGVYEKRFAGNGEEVHHFYWNRDWTIFANADDVPVIFRFGAATFGGLLAAPAPAQPSLPK